MPMKRRRENNPTIIYLPALAPLPRPILSSRYILHCVHACDGSTVAAALSNHHIKTYDRRTLEPTSSSSLKGHRGPITSLCPSPDHPSSFVSSSEDQTVRLWDIRGPNKNACTAVINQEDEALSCTLGAGTGLLAVGVGNAVDFFDSRKAGGGGGGGKLGRYADVHTDLVTKVAFHPSRRATLASGSEDGLICLYDTGVGQADEALVCILNAECPVRDLTFFGVEGDGLASLTGSEGTMVWHWPSAARALHIEDLRQVVPVMGAKGVGEKGGLFSVQYHYDQGGDRLLLALSDVEGQITVLQVMPGGGMHPVLQLQQGHTALVRAVDLWDGSWVTGGEDARLCLWGGEEAGEGVAATGGTEKLTKRKKGKEIAHYKPY